MCLANPCDSLIVYVHSQVSAFCAFVSGSVAQGDIAPVSGAPGFESLSSRSQAAAGWLIFVTVIAMLVEGALIAARFLNFGFVATTIFQIVVSPPPPSPHTHTHTHTHTYTHTHTHTHTRTHTPLFISLG